MACSPVVRRLPLRHDAADMMPGAIASYKKGTLEKCPFFVLPPQSVLSLFLDALARITDGTSDLLPRCFVLLQVPRGITHSLADIFHRFPQLCLGFLRLKCQY